MAYVLTQAGSGALPQRECEVCGRLLAFYGAKGWQERHERSERHRRHEMLTRRASQGWIPLHAHALTMARARGLCVEREYTQGGTLGAEGYGASAVYGTAIDFARAEEIEDAVGRDDSPTRRSLRAVLAAVATVRATGMPWRLAWTQAADDAALPVAQRPYWWVS